MAIEDDTADWASDEFAQANLGDARLSQRLVALARQLPELDVFAIHVIEDAPPAGVEPLEWMLLSSVRANLDHPMKIKAVLVLELVVNLLLPWLVYRLALPHFGRVGALYASAVPPLVWTLTEFAKSRRLDALSVLVLLGIALSIVLMALGGSPRILLVRESLVSGAIGIAFLFSLLREQPLVFYLARATIAREQRDGAGHFETAWRERPQVRASIRLMTLVWGIALTGETLLRCWLAWHWPVERCLVVLPLISYVIYGGLMLWTFWFRGRMRERERAVQR